MTTGESAAPRILIVEDEEGIATMLDKGLRSYDYDTILLADGSEVMASVADVDLVLLDLGLPGKDGLEVLEELRAGGSNVPVIILTARDEVDDRVRGLDLGADDYVTKPFVFEELLARVRARLRGATAPLALEVRGITLDLRTRAATAGGAEVTLTTREASLLETFLRHPDQILSRAELESMVWAGEETASNIVDVYVRYLRQKLGGAIVETVRGSGYRLGAAAAPAPST